MKRYAQISRGTVSLLVIMMVSIIVISGCSKGGNPAPTPTQTKKIPVIDSGTFLVLTWEDITIKNGDTTYTQRPPTDCEGAEVFIFGGNSHFVTSEKCTALGFNGTWVFDGITVTITNAADNSIWLNGPVKIIDHNNIVVTNLNGLSHKIRYTLRRF
jgi:hypothetical protein